MAKIRCLECGAWLDMTAIMKDTEWREVLELSHRFGPYSKLIFEYADSFRAKPGRSMPLKKQIRILQEVLAMYEKETFSFQRSQYAVTKVHIIEGIRRVCDRELTNLQNHNYLKKILLGLLEKDRNKKEAQEETRKEIEKQYPYRQRKEVNEEVPQERAQELIQGILKKWQKF